MRVRYRDLALSDLDRIFHYLDERSPASAPSVRVKVVSRYGYKIFYSVEADSIEILHVRHGARRPWPAEQSPSGG